MPRPTPAQICYGTLTVVSATVLLLAVSGAESLLGITVLVVLALALGTLATALSIAGQARRGRAGSRIVGRSNAQYPSERTAEPQRVPQQQPAATTEAGYAHPSSGRP